MRKGPMILLSILPIVGSVSHPLGSDCPRQWGGGPGFPGMSQDVMALKMFDDGTGMALYAGGRFFSAGGITVNSIAKWTGAAWQQVGSGVLPGASIVAALTIYDDGSGPALYAGGAFSSAGGTTCANIAKWNGTSWSALGTGAGTSQETVEALAVFDDGTNGPELIVGGNFATAGGTAASRIAKWNGSSWSVLGTGMGPNTGFQSAPVFALAVYDDGTGPELFAGGDFTTAGGVAAPYIARWNGSSWASVGSGMNKSVRALAVYDDGSGSALYAGGDFTSAGGISANGIARWNGSSWQAVGGGVGFSVTGVEALSVINDGTGSALYVGGSFTTAAGGSALRIAKWDGTAWSALGAGMNGFVDALEGFDDGSGVAVYAGGGFTNAGGLAANYIARWKPTCPPCPSCGIQLPCAGTNWIALPTSSSMHRAEDLCDALGPAATSVSQFFPDGAGRYTWTCPTGPCTSASGQAEPGTCNSACFCIDDGEGYEVVTTGATSVQLYGNDESRTIYLPSGGTDYLVSPPCLSTATTARQFLDLVPGGNLATTTLTGRDECTGLVFSFAGNAPGPGFTLVPGRAYRLKFGNTTGASYLNPANATPATSPNLLNPQVRLACITGSSNNIGWSWWIDLGADGVGRTSRPEPYALKTGPIPSGQGPTAFVASFLGSMNSVCPGIAATSPLQSDCFSITAPSPFTLWVGPYGLPPNCDVGLGACQFNPTITFGTTRVPILTPVGCASLMMVLISIGSLWIYRSKNLK
jgi:hypothetical protein